MISELQIKNIALIRELSLELDSGFTVFTGETGAGKSILVGSLGLLLGDRASKELIRNSETDAEVTAVFDVENYRNELQPHLDEMDLRPDEDGTLIIRRIISRRGKNKTYINQTPVPLSSLKRIGELLIDFHGQHDHQSLLQPHTAMEIIDSLDGVSEHKKAYSNAWREYRDAREALDSFNDRIDRLRQRRDMMEYQYNEIHSLSLKPNEEHELEEKLGRLSSVTQRIESAAEIQAILSRDETSPLSQLYTIQKHLHTLARYDSSFTQWGTELTNLVSMLSELESTTAVYAEETETDPRQVDEINERLAAIQRLKRKYECDLDGLLQMQQRLKEDLDRLETTDIDRPQLQKQCEAAYERCMEAAGRLRSARETACHTFDKKVSSQMQHLGFSHGAFKTAFTPLETPASEGTETIEFTVRTNQGEPYTPLRKTASGGEISRLMLAIKSVLAEKDNVPVLVFDEIDVGIGGITSNAIAGALNALSTHHQVISISHLHQIASQAHHHFRVYKEIEGERTVTRATALDKNEKIEELSRMMGGSSDVSKKHAEEMLKRSP